MNERIRELFKLAGGKTSIQNLMSNPMQQREYSELWDGNIQKFAELIIKECAKVAYKYTDKPSNFELYSEIGWECLPGDLQDHIEKHFGVE
jgi:hypothetical protein